MVTARVVGPRYDGAGLVRFLAQGLNCPGDSRRPARAADRLSAGRHDDREFTEWTATAMPGETLARFRRWFWRPPRPHGETIPDRAVSPLELFYDLVYVVVISQAAHHLAAHPSLRAFVEFAIVFALLWLAWINGSLYLELHGREDGRTRTYVFAQMGLVALLAVFTADAVDGDGPAFALVYAAFLLLMTWLWYTVRRQDRASHPEFLADTGRYLTIMGVSMVAIVASALLPATPRLIVWAGVALAWFMGLWLQGRSPVGLARGLPPSHSLAERFEQFTIIVLGEVVLGVVEGMSAAKHDLKTITTGLIALVLGFGFWWIYFDVVGRRLPRREGRALAQWLLSHYPITLAIATAGAAMVDLIGHAHAARTPATTAGLLAGAVALSLLAQIATMRALADAERLAVVYRPLTWAMAGGAAAALIAGWARPAPWLLAVLLVAVLSAVWCFAVGRFLRVDAWGSREAFDRSASGAASVGE